MKQKTRSSAWRYWPGYALILGLIVLAIVLSPSVISGLCLIGAFGVLICIGAVEEKRKKAEEARRNANNPDARTNAPQNGSVTPAKSASSASADNGRKFELPDFTLFRLYEDRSETDRNGSFSVSRGTVKIMQLTGRLFIERSYTDYVDSHNLMHSCGQSVRQETIDYDTLYRLIDQSADEQAKRYRDMNADNWKKFLRSDEPFPAPDMPVVSFGRYETEKQAGVRQPLAWYVLEKQEDRCLLLCRDVIECLQYDRDCGGDLLYRDSLIRKWLNETFPGLAFEREEEEMILETDVRCIKILNHEEHLHLTRQVMDDTAVRDKVFLLSDEELKRYIPEEKEMAAMPTGHALRSGVVDLIVHSADTDFFRLAGAARWWMRDLYMGDRKRECRAQTGSWFGGISSFPTDAPGIGVRPALWIRREAIETTENKRS